MECLPQWDHLSRLRPVTYNVNSITRFLTVKLRIVTKLSKFNFGLSVLFFSSVSNKPSSTMEHDIGIG